MLISSTTRNLFFASFMGRVVADVIETRVGFSRGKWRFGAMALLFLFSNQQVSSAERLPLWDCRSAARALVSADERDIWD